MKKILTIIASTMILSPVNAESFNDYIHSNSHTIRCMISGRCKDGIKEINDITDISSSSPDTDFSMIAVEVNKMLNTLKKIEVKVFLADEKYFPFRYRGIYSTSNNRFFLNSKYLHNPRSILFTIRHEGWHVAQDCMSTLANSTLLNVLDHHIIPIEIKEETIERYGLDPYVVRIEREAVWASTIPGMTATALSVCNSEFPMWEEYDPPSRTRSWLYINGYL